MRVEPGLDVSPADAQVAAAGSRFGTLLMILLGIAWFAIFPARSLSEPDEGRYAEIPREMLAGVDWVVPRLNGIQYLDKPPLQYWMTAAAYSVLGMEPWVSRLWTLITGFLGIVVVYLGGARLFGDKAGRNAALLLAGSPLYAIIGHINLLDMGFAFLLTVALVSFLCGMQEADTRRRRYWLWSCWAAIGLAFLQKGLVALLLPGIALALYTLVERDFGLWKRLHLVSGLLIVLLIAAPWVVVMAARNPDFLSYFFIHEHFLRFLTPVHRRVEPWWYFGAVFIGGFWPWLPLAWRGALSAWRPVARGAVQVGGIDVSRFLLIWAASILIFFSLSSSKLAPYILPAMAPLALLGGKAIAELQRTWALWASCALSFTLGAILLLARPVIGAVMEYGPKRELYLDASNPLMAGGFVMVLAVIVAAALLARGRRNSSTTFLGAGLLIGWMIALPASNVLEPLRGVPGAAAAIKPLLGNDTKFYCVGKYVHSLNFVLRRNCVVVEWQGDLKGRPDDGERNYIATTAEFYREWQRETDAVAIVEPAYWPYLQQAGLPAHVVFDSPRGLVLHRN